MLKKSLWSVAAVTLLMIPSIARSQTIPSTVAAGPHGYDWQIGTWSCINSMPATPFGGPSTQTENVSRTSGGAIFFHVTGNNYDSSAYNVYVPTKKMWVSPLALADGTYGTESTTQSGKKIVWTGTAVDAAGKTTKIRDTIVYGETKYSDLGESLLAGNWKAQYKLTCTRR